MESQLIALLRELEEFGAANDASTDDRDGKMLNITRDTGEFLSLLVKSTKSKNVLELGTSNGYSTLWLADAVGERGAVTTVERGPHKRTMAARNFRRADLQSRITQIAGDAGGFIDSRNADEYDFVFLDSDRGQYVDWWGSLQRILTAGGLLVVDNAISHADQLAEFSQLVRDSDGYPSSLVSIGNGELVILKDVQ